ncbi:MAG: L-histidine N(alpha)-methyltransferase [Thermoanaerobaculia bacterium]
MTTAPGVQPWWEPARRRAGLIDLHPDVANFREEAVAGLRSSPKRVSPKFFYDERGSALFERITRLPEYYPTRTEIEILEEHAESLATILGERWELLELGSGSSRKTRILLESAGGNGTYVPIDIAKESLVAAAEGIAQEFPDVNVVAVCADYTAPIPLARFDPSARRIIFFPGSTIGNFDPDDARDFLAHLGGMLEPDDRMIVGVDLQKDPATLHAAYNDAAGVTARFNCNVLERMNRELGANFDLRRFEHLAFYDPKLGRIEMHLRSRGEQTVRIDGEEIRFENRETIHTENSYKYTREGFRRLAREAGLATVEIWTDPGLLFSVWILAPQRI